VVATINDANYQGSATGTLVIGQATGAIALGDLSQTYDGGVKAATATTTPSGLTVTYTYNGSAAVPAAAGSYAVVATIDNPNYQGSTSGSLVVNKATLTVTADNKSRFCGQSNPTLTASYSGFVSGENTGVLTSPVALNTTATGGCPVGQYPITASGAAAANYTINYVGGTLAVIAVPQITGTSAVVNGNNQFIVSWLAVSGHTYQLESTDDLGEIAWNPAGNPVVGTDAMVYVTNNVSDAVKRFFRVGVQ
jgi:large repetitive protein